MNCGAYKEEIGGWTVRRARCECGQFTMKDYHSDEKGLTITHGARSDRSFEDVDSQIPGAIETWGYDAL